MLTIVTNITYSFCEIFITNPNTITTTSIPSTLNKNVPFFFNIFQNFSFPTEGLELTYNSVISSFINFILGLDIIILIGSVLSLIIKFHNKYLHAFLIRQIYFFLTILEKEISNLNILIKLLSSFLLFIIIYNINIFAIEITPIILVLSFYFLLLLVVAVLLIPLYLIYNYGVYFLAYIRGASLKKNLFFELLVDCLNLISYFLRINIQFIRIMLINFMFFMYEESYYEIIYP